MYAQSLERFVNIAKRYIGGGGIQTIVELGARDCAETLGFHKLISTANIYAFEPNPSTLPTCREKVKPFSNVHLIEKAVGNVNGKVQFYQIDQERTVTSWVDGNPGASSLFVSSDKYPVERYVQKEIEVESITLGSFMQIYGVSEIDLLWMDIQGAELLALEGLGHKISEVKLIHLEVGFFEIYQNQPLFGEIKRFLNSQGFLLVGFTSFGYYSGDVAFVNRKLIRNKLDLLKLLIYDISAAPWHKIQLRTNNFLLRIRSKLSRVVHRISEKRRLLQ